MAKALHSALGGDSYYSKHNPHAKYVYGKVLQMTKECIFQQRESGFQRKDNILTLADYGSGDGNSLLSILPDISELLQKMCPNKDTNVVFIYLKDNDYKSIIKNIKSYESKSSRYFQPDAEINKIKYNSETFFSIVCRDFFQQCVPDESVSIGFCNTAMHWVSKKPCHLKELIVNFVEDDHVKELFSKQAELDWESFLLKRSAELKMGGYFLRICVWNR